MSLDRSRLRAALRRAFEPLARPVLGRVDARTDYRIRLNELTAKSSLSQQLPAVLNAISSQNATARELRRHELERQEALEALELRLSLLEEMVAALRGEIHEVLARLEPTAPAGYAVVRPPANP